MQESVKSNLLLMLIEFSFGRVSYSEFKDRLELHGRDIFLGEDAYGQNLLNLCKESISIADLWYIQKLTFDVVKRKNYGLWLKHLNIFILEQLEDIKVAFKNVSIEGGISLDEALTDEGFKKRSEEENLVHWSDVPYESLENGVLNYYYSSLDEIGFRYYLPADLSYCLRFFIDNIYAKDEDKKCYIQNMLISLKVDIERNYDNFKLFSVEQKSCVKQFLHLFYLLEARYDENEEFTCVYEKL